MQYYLKQPCKGQNSTQEWETMYSKDFSIIESQLQAQASIKFQPQTSREERFK